MARCEFRLKPVRFARAAGTAKGTDRRSDISPIPRVPSEGPSPPPPSTRPRVPGRPLLSLNRRPRCRFLYRRSIKAAIRMRPIPATAPNTLPATVPTDVELELDPEPESLVDVEDAEDKSPLAVLPVPLPTPLPPLLVALPPKPNALMDPPSSDPVEVADPVEDASVKVKLEDTPIVVVYVSLYSIVPDDEGSIDVVRLAANVYDDAVLFEEEEEDIKTEFEVEVVGAASFGILDDKSVVCKSDIVQLTTCGVCHASKGWVR